MLNTSLPADAVARILAALVRRVMADSPLAASVHAVLFGAPCGVAVGGVRLCTVTPSDGGVDLEWAPHSSEARALLLPVLAAMLGR